MIVVTRQKDISQLKTQMPSNFEIISWDDFSMDWKQYRSIFRLFLNSDHEELLVISEPNRINLQEVSSLKATNFFDCFDVTLRQKFLPINPQRFKFLLRLWMPVKFLNYLNNFLNNQFLMRLIDANTRARAISYVAKEISTHRNVRTNWLSHNPAGIIYSRKAASTLSEFNISNLLSPERVLISVLRSSNLACGAFL
jgi:hypothetical protein